MRRFKVKSYQNEFLDWCDDVEDSPSGAYVRLSDAPKRFAVRNDAGKYLRVTKDRKRRWAKLESATLWDKPTHARAATRALRSFDGYDGEVQVVQVYYAVVAVD